MADAGAIDIGFVCLRSVDQNFDFFLVNWYLCHLRYVLNANFLLLQKTLYIRVLFIMFKKWNCTDRCHITLPNTISWYLLDCLKENVTSVSLLSAQSPCGKYGVDLRNFRNGNGNDFCLDSSLTSVLSKKVWMYKKMH